MRTFLKVIAWVGFGIVFLGVIIAFIQSWVVWFPEPGFRGGLNIGHPIAMFLAIIGVPLMLVGGIIAKPKLFWLPSFIVGSLYIIAFIPCVQNLVFYLRHTDPDYLMQRGELFRLLWYNLGPLIPGIIGIAGGILIWRIETRSEAKRQTAEITD